MWANSGPRGYWRWNLKASFEGTDWAITAPSAVWMTPRGWEKSRTTARLFDGWLLRSLAWMTWR